MSAVTSIKPRSVSKRKPAYSTDCAHRWCFFVLRDTPSWPFRSAHHLSSTSAAFRLRPHSAQPATSPPQAGCHSTRLWKTKSSTQTTPSMERTDAPRSSPGFAPRSAA